MLDSRLTPEKGIPHDSRRHPDHRSVNCSSSPRLTQVLVCQKSRERAFLASLLIVSYAEIDVLEGKSRGGNAEQASNELYQQIMSHLRIGSVKVESALGSSAIPTAARESLKLSIKRTINGAALASLNLDEAMRLFGSFFPLLQRFHWPGSLGSPRESSTTIEFECNEAI